MCTTSCRVEPVQLQVVYAMYTGFPGSGTAIQVVYAMYWIGTVILVAYAMNLMYWSQYSYTNSLCHVLGVLEQATALQVAYVMSWIYRYSYIASTAFIAVPAPVYP